jgi:uncharacterized protein
MLGELNETQISNILSSQVVGRLACTDGKQPYIVPVTYTYDGEYIYGQTNEGTKLNILRKNKNVCFEVDTMTDMQHWQSIIVFGKFEELKEETAKTARDILFNRVLTLMTSSTVHVHEHATSTTLENNNRERHVMYRIKIEKITGRFEN